MDRPTTDAPDTGTTEPTATEVDLGDAVALTLGSAKSTQEAKRHIYN